MKEIQDTVNISQIVVRHERPGVQRTITRKLTERFARPYTIQEVVSANVIKFRFPASMKTHLVVNVSRIVQYKKLVKEQRIEESKLIEINKKEE